MAVEKQSPADPAASAPPEPDVRPPAEALRSAGEDIRQLLDYVSYYISAKVDLVKLAIRNAALYAVLGIIGLIVLGSVLVTAAVLVVTGIAQALAIAFHSVWLAALVTGMAILGIVAFTGYFVLTKATKTFHRTMVKKYESRRQQQQSEHGTDVQQQAESARRNGR